MGRIGFILAAIDVAFMIFALIDVILTQQWRVRGVPKIVWAVIVLLLSPIGGILWFLIGKEPIEATTPSRFASPDDDPDFLARMRRDEAQDERIRRLEQELADLDDDKPKE